jgi:predicted 2-oxoglutarate/Fe(II)-dependent dioxygenase YbiX
MESPWKIEPGFFGTGPENIHVIKNFIDEKDVARISAFARTISEWSNGSDVDIFDENGVCTYNAAYWNNRQCTWDILQRINKEVYDLIDFYLDKMAVTAGEIYGCKLQKRPPCIVRWFKGIEQRPHADKQMNDGSPNPFPTYDINSVFYWNDDFEGGELYYPQHDMVVKPEPGLAVIHPGDINYLHGVKIVTSGERYTSPAFFTVE